VIADSAPTGQTASDKFGASIIVVGGEIHGGNLRFHDLSGWKFY
jgi:hypothetical protein